MFASALLFSVLLFIIFLWCNKLCDILSKKLTISVNTSVIVNPESAAKAKQYRKENWKQWQRTGEEWNAIQREHRAYKQKLYKDGELN